MKYLYLVRHAKSSWEDPSLSDFDRPLNKRGKRDAPFMARLLSGMLPQPDILISSPAERAKTTARHFQREFSVPDERFQFDNKLYHASVSMILKVVNDIDNQWERAAIFGHNPGFTDFANEIGDAGIDNVPTCGVVVLESKAELWENFGDYHTKTEAFHYPKKYLE